MHLQKQQDLIYGEHNEKRAIEIIYNNFDINKVNKLDTFHHMDFESEFSFFEVKSRRFNHNRYETTMIGFDKVKFAQSSNKDVYFIFMFNDGNYYYKYNIEDEFKSSIGGRMDRGKSELRLYHFIPISVLKKLK